METRREGSQTRTCFYCGVPENVMGIELHHAIKRSRAPDRIDDKTNLVPLCAEHHRLTETSEAFLQEILTLWEAWKKNPSPWME